MKETNLLSLREQIDAINLEILNLLNQRFNILEKVKKIKEKENLPLHDPEREREMIDHLIHINQGPMPSEALCSIFKQILHQSVVYMQNK